MDNIFSFSQNKPAKKRPQKSVTSTTTASASTINHLPIRNVIPAHAPTLEAMLKTVTTAQPTIAMLGKTAGITATLTRLPLTVKTEPISAAPTMAIIKPPPAVLGAPAVAAATSSSKKKVAESASTVQPPQAKSPRRQPAKKQVKRSRSCENPVKSGE